MQNRNEAFTEVMAKITKSNSRNCEKLKILIFISLLIFHDMLNKTTSQFLAKAIDSHSDFNLSKYYF